MKVVELVGSIPALRKILLAEIDGLLAYKLNKFVKLSSPEVDSYSAARTKLFEKYGTKDKKTGQMSISEEDKGYPEFMKELKELEDIELSKEIKVPKMKASELSLIKGITSVEVGALEWLIDDDLQD